MRGAQARECLVVAMGRQRVGPRDDDDVGVRGGAGGGGGADPCQEFGGEDELLVGEVAAALLLDLVLDMEGGYAGADVLCNGSVDVGRTWEMELVSRLARGKGFHLYAGEAVGRFQELTSVASVHVRNQWYRGV